MTYRDADFAVTACMPKPNRNTFTYLWKKTYISIPFTLSKKLITLPAHHQSRQHKSCSSDSFFANFDFGFEAPELPELPELPQRTVRVLIVARELTPSMVHGLVDAPLSPSHCDDCDQYTASTADEYYSAQESAFPYDSYIHTRHAGSQRYLIHFWIVNASPQKCKNFALFKSSIPFYIFIRHLLQ
jgi:hypothetical protein